jgi:hypothetical protein
MKRYLLPKCCQPWDSAGAKFRIGSVVPCGLLGGNDTIIGLGANGQALAYVYARETREQAAAPGFMLGLGPSAWIAALAFLELSVFSRHLFQRDGLKKERHIVRTDTLTT